MTDISDTTSSTIAPSSEIIAPKLTENTNFNNSNTINIPTKISSSNEEIKKSNEQRITILYGSQTGTAQDVAERIWREAKKYKFKASVLPMNDYPVINFMYDQTVIFVCATTGQGEEPDNMKSFWKILLRKNLPSDALVNVSFAVLGLGDSSYTKFNFVAKRLYKRLQQLGAEAMLSLYLADDQHELGIDATVDPFIDELWKKIFLKYPLPINFKPPTEDIICRWNIAEVNGGKPSANNKGTKNIFDLENGKAFKVKIKANERITNNQHFQNVRLIKFRSEDIQTYQPGDVLMIRPKNLEDQVTEFFNILHKNKMKFNRKTKVKITAKFDEMPVPNSLKTTLTLEQICREYWDLNAIPRRYTFYILSKITTSDFEREKCFEFTTAQGQEELYNYCNRPRRNILEVLHDFPYATAHLTLDTLFEIMSPIKTRAFSIASSSAAHPNEIHIIVAVVKYRTILVKERYGLCSTWLSNLSVGDEIYVHIKKGSFRFPYLDDYSLENIPPIIMIGPGTGVAPFRSYIMERVTLGNATKNKLILFFGCRNQKGDFLCKAEFDKLIEQDKFTLICAFSRDQPEKVYVQHKMLEHQEYLYDLIYKKNAHIYIAGNSKNMPNDVRQAFITILTSAETMIASEAEDYIEYLEKCGRYQTETWS